MATGEFRVRGVGFPLRSFTMVPPQLFAAYANKHISGDAVGLFLGLALWADAQGMVLTGRGRMAQALKLTERNLRHYLLQLEQVGLIRRSVPSGKHGRKCIQVMMKETDPITGAGSTVSPYESSPTYRRGGKHGKLRGPKSGSLPAGKAEVCPPVLGSETDLEKRKFARRQSGSLPAGPNPLEVLAPLVDDCGFGGGNEKKYKKEEDVTFPVGCSFEDEREEEQALPDGSAGLPEADLAPEKTGQGRTSEQGAYPGVFEKVGVAAGPPAEPASELPPPGGAEGPGDPLAHDGGALMRPSEEQVEATDRPGAVLRVVKGGAAPDRVRSTTSGRRRGRLFDDPEAQPVQIDKAARVWVQAEQMLPSTPEEVLAAFADTMELRYGDKVRDQLQLTLSGKQRKLIRDRFLDRFSGAVVLDAIRVLVWDWEEAGIQCWPKCSDPRPSVKALIDYADRLTAVVATGFDVSSSALRGRHGYAVRVLGPRVQLELAALKPQGDWTRAEVEELSESKPDDYARLQSLGAVPNLFHIQHWDDDDSYNSRRKQKDTK